MSVKFDVPTDEEMKRAEADLEEKHSGERTRSILNSVAPLPGK